MTRHCISWIIEIVADFNETVLNPFTSTQVENISRKGDLLKDVKQSTLLSRSRTSSQLDSSFAVPPAKRAKGANSQAIIHGTFIDKTLGLIPPISHPFIPTQHLLISLFGILSCICRQFAPCLCIFLLIPMVLHVPSFSTETPAKAPREALDDMVPTPKTPAFTRGMMTAVESQTKPPRDYDALKLIELRPLKLDAEYFNSYLYTGKMVVPARSTIARQDDRAATPKYKLRFPSSKSKRDIVTPITMSLRSTSTQDFTTVTRNQSAKLSNGVQSTRGRGSALRGKGELVTPHVSDARTRVVTRQMTGVRTRRTPAETSSNDVETSGRATRRHLRYHGEGMDSDFDVEMDEVDTDYDIDLDKDDHEDDDEEGEEEGEGTSKKKAGKKTKPVRGGDDDIPPMRLTRLQEALLTAAKPKRQESNANPTSSTTTETTMTITPTRRGGKQSTSEDRMTRQLSITITNHGHAEALSGGIRNGTRTRAAAAALHSAMQHAADQAAAHGKGKESVAELAVLLESNSDSDDEGDRETLACSSDDNGSDDEGCHLSERRGGRRRHAMFNEMSDMETDEDENGNDEGIVVGRQEERIIPIVVKYPLMGSWDEWKDSFQTCKDEVDMYREIKTWRCPYLLRFYGTHGPGIVFEYVDGDALDDLLDVEANQEGEEGDQTNDPEAKSLFEDQTWLWSELGEHITTALYYLHNLNISHNDIKPSNVRYSKTKGLWKLLDLGLATDLKTVVCKNIGTDGYRAPEVQTRGVLHPKSDVYGLGVMMEECIPGIIRRYARFDGITKRKKALLRELHSTASGRIKAQLIEAGEQRLIELNGIMREIVTRCLDKNPDKRPSIRRLVHVFRAVRPKEEALVLSKKALDEVEAEYGL